MDNGKILDGFEAVIIIQADEQIIHGREEKVILEILKTDIGGGFRITNPVKGFTELVDWNETKTAIFEKEKLEVKLDDLRFDYIRFTDQANFDSFKTHRDQSFEDEEGDDPFKQFSSIVARPSLKRTDTQVARESDLNDQDYMRFDVLKEVQYIFGAHWKKHDISMERVAPSNLWQVQLALEENIDKDVKPEDIFLLENVD